MKNRKVETKIMLDTLKVRIKQVLHLKYILHIFETISGLKVNWMKSSLAGIGGWMRGSLIVSLRCWVVEWISGL